MDLGFKLNSMVEKQLDRSREFMKRVMAMKDSKGRKLSKARVTLVGHSLGGFIVQVLAVEQAVPAVTFNAPGAAHYNAKLKSSLIRDVVGTMGKHIGKSDWVKKPPSNQRKTSSIRPDT
jgi:putative lipase involved disintegration of autophagic bodies